MLCVHRYAEHGRAGRRATGGQAENCCSPITDSNCSFSAASEPGAAVSTSLRRAEAEGRYADVLAGLSALPA
ncbi:hypothetical protein [Trujillonella endophytica]|uniref:Uncharacterized protein n=1 Tax=Trujillonella endophytica TaxID=673521 RepID=A0A1H8VVA5_9ACTN|nr:hypothetical protein [Trujillella endophytica]SEP19336.1 hypothetical protein SAMN05660991_03807 [Trujillella endophytica]